MRRTLRVGLLIGGILGYTLVWADEVTDQIESAKKLYLAKKYSEAVAELRFALAQIQSKQAERLTVIMPEPLRGWKADKAAGQYASAELMGGGMSIHRHYYVESSDKSVDVEAVTDSPLLQAAMMWLSSPMFGAMGGSTGKKPIKVEGNKAMLEFDAEKGTGELQMVVGTKTLVTVKGHGLDSSDVLVEYAKRVNTAKLKELVGE